jgi:hypothetical protein
VPTLSRNERVGVVLRVRSSYAVKLLLTFPDPSPPQPMTKKEVTMTTQITLGRFTTLILMLTVNGKYTARILDPSPVGGVSSLLFLRLLAVIPRQNPIGYAGNWGCSPNSV